MTDRLQAVCSQPVFLCRSGYPILKAGEFMGETGLAQALQPSGLQSLSATVSGLSATLVGRFLLSIPVILLLLGILLLARWLRRRKAEAAPIALPDKRGLLRAIRKDQFELYLQFVYDVRVGRLVGVEALSRWNHPQMGVLPPSQFIDDMREEGLIDILDFQMLEKSCRLLEQWKKDGSVELNLSCNFTRDSLSDEDFARRFRKVVRKYDFIPENLIIEITEDALFASREYAYQNILACKECGVRVALDDMGAGYTSVSDLGDFPVDIIKIDRRLIKQTSQERGKALLRGIVDMAHRLKIEALCEGVETEQERQTVIECGSDYIQGYYYSHVYPVEAALEKYRSSTAV